MDEIEIFPPEDDNGSMVMSDDFSRTTITIDKVRREYDSWMSLTQDAYGRTQRYKYKINTHPLEVKSKLEERIDEPPERYAVRDGVVLESELMKNGVEGMTESLVENLRKEVEWNSLGLGNPVGWYILSMHPEIVSKEEFKKHLRSVEERIKNGLAKVDRYLADSKSGFIAKDEKFGRNIYPENENISEEDHKKATKQINALHDKLFNKDSEAYVGMTSDEFWSSAIMLKVFNLFLNLKEAMKANSSRTRFRNSKWLLPIILGLIALSWGVWDAIGVFILGAIIVNQLSSKHPV